MPLEGRDAAYLWDIIDHAKELAELVAGQTYERYLADRQLRLATERVIEIIGEAARRLSTGFKTEHSEIAWAEIVAQRNVLVHGYDRIDYERIWRVATVDAPALVDALTVLLPPEPRTEDG